MSADNLKVCLECGDLGTGTRCPACQTRAEQRRGGAHARGYTRQWQRKAAAVRRAEPACGRCGSTADLTVDHVIPKSAGGTDERSNLMTLCRSCNSAKGPRL